MSLPETFESLFPPSPLPARAQRLPLVHEQKSIPVWIAYTEHTDLSQPGFELDCFFTPSEMERANRFRFEKPRNSFLLSRLAAKAALAAFFNEPDWRKITVSNGMLGQPLVNYAGNFNADTSLTHSEHEAVAIAFPREYPLAIDLEVVSPNRVETIKEALRLTSQEQQWIKSGLVTEALAYVTLWTIREALSKALRCGLTCPLELLAVDQIKLQAGKVWETRYQNFQQYKCLSWLQANRVFSLTLPHTINCDPA